MKPQVISPLIFSALAISSALWSPVAISLSTSLQKSFKVCGRPNIVKKNYDSYFEKLPGRYQKVRLADQNLPSEKM